MFCGSAEHSLQCAVDPAVESGHCFRRADLDRYQNLAVPYAPRIPVRGSVTNVGPGSTIVPHGGASPDASVEAACTRWRCVWVHRSGAAWPARRRPSNRAYRSGTRIAGPSAHDRAGALTAGCSCGPDEPTVIGRRRAQTRGQGASPASAATLRGRGLRYLLRRSQYL